MVEWRGNFLCFFAWQDVGARVYIDSMVIERIQSLIVQYMPRAAKASADAIGMLKQKPCSPGCGKCLEMRMRMLESLKAMFISYSAMSLMIVELIDGQVELLIKSAYSASAERWN